MLNSKSIAGKFFPTLLLLFLLLVPLVAQTCNAQSTQMQQDKAFSFLRDVIGLDVDHYKFTVIQNSTNIRENITYLSYKVEPKTFAFWESITIDFQFSTDTLAMVNVKPDANNLVYTRQRLDRFNETLGILERYQTWLNDPQVGEMADLLRKVGSEQSILQASGNLSVRIQLYSDIAEYRFSNYINGVEYSGVRIAQSRSGSIFFADNRASQKIGNTTIGISEDQARTIALDYVSTHPFRGTTQDSNTLANVDITGIKAVHLKSTQRMNGTLYPYYEVQFNIDEKSRLQGCGVNVGANDGEILSAYSHSSSTNITLLGALASFPWLILAIASTVIVVVGLFVSRRKHNKTGSTVVA